MARRIIRFPVDRILRIARFPVNNEYDHCRSNGIVERPEDMTSGTDPDGVPDAAVGSARPSLLYVAKQLELVVRARLDEILKDEGITALQYTALTVLDRHDGLSPAQLARDSFVTPQSTAGLVANLERRGLVRRERNPASRRELVVRLTAAGRRLLLRHAAEVAALEARMTGSLDPVAVDVFRAYLDACRLALS
jgi:DNA-binding MarR family transcriptional regulator